MLWQFGLDSPGLSTGLSEVTHLATVTWQLCWNLVASLTIMEVGLPDGLECSLIMVTDPGFLMWYSQGNKNLRAEAESHLHLKLWSPIMSFLLHFADKDKS
jgi:hypothetical protein